jgi:hypothetical protein
MKKKKTNPFLTLIFILFIVYISLFIAGESGYYENEINEEITLTEENIKKFEEDVKNNKDIDLQDYVVNEKKNYSCFASDMGDNFSNFIEKLMTKELGKMGKVLKKMFS